MEMLHANLSKQHGLKRLSHNFSLKNIHDSSHVMSVLFFALEGLFVNP